jgi:hypothetical protein
MEKEIKAMRTTVIGIVFSASLALLPAMAQQNTGVPGYTPLSTQLRKCYVDNSRRTRLPTVFWE